MGLPIPKEISDVPDLLPSLSLFWRCYFDLRRGLDRHKTVSWRDVQLWCETYRLDRELAQACHEYTATMDGIWITLLPSEKGKPDGDKSGNKRG